MERKKMHLSTFFYIANWFLASCAFPKPHRQHNSIYLHWLILFQRKDLIFSKINKSIISFISHIANSQISLWYWKILISAVGSTNGIFVVRSVDNSSTLFSNKVSTLVNESCVSKTSYRAASASCGSMVKSSYSSECSNDQNELMFTILLVKSVICREWPKSLPHDPGNYVKPNNYNSLTYFDNFLHVITESC